jgi:predicted nuclease of restriction endonuclease-like (RecB) superfamily
MKATTDNTVKKATANLPDGYAETLQGIKDRIRAAQVKASLSVNREMIALYWHIGGVIVERQKNEGWGKSVVRRLAADLQTAFPGMSGFSPQNVWFMRSFHLAWTQEVGKSSSIETGATEKLSQPVRELDGKNLPQPMAEIPWGHNRILLTKVKQPAERLWYARMTLENGWSRNILDLQIDNDLYGRQGKALTNFKRTLPAPQSDLAQQTLKDPYTFDFLTLATDAAERQLERGLVDHIVKFLLEMGAGFAFVGRQVHLAVDDEDYYLDLLFYHARLHCYVVVDLKAGRFKPEHAGKMNFYLSAVDDQLRTAQDNPSIGLILCRYKKQTTVEYALRHIGTPVGVAEWQTKLVKALPKELKGCLPTVEEIEKELGDGR